MGQPRILSPLDRCVGGICLAVCVYVCVQACAHRQQQLLLVCWHRPLTPWVQAGRVEQELGMGQQASCWGGKILDSA